VPCLIRWPAVVKPGTAINDIGKKTLLKGKTIGDMTYKVHPDG
jgi:hypothetical protein